MPDEGDEYFSQIANNPFKLDDDFEIYRSRVDARRQRIEQTHLMNSTPIHLRSSGCSGRSKMLGLSLDRTLASSALSLRSSKWPARAAGLARTPPRHLSTIGLVRSAGTPSAADTPGTPGPVLPRDLLSRLDLYSPAYTEKYAHLLKQDREFLEGLVRDPGPRPKMLDFLGVQREIFLAEFSLQTKRAEIAQLDGALRAREDDIRRASRTLDGEVSRFDKFVRHSDLGTVRSISESEQAVKMRTQRQESIRAASGQVISLKSEIAKSELLILQLFRYRLFLEELITPSDRDALVARREAYTSRRRAVALCVERYGHCDGLCLDCFCMALPEALVRAGGGGQGFYSLLAVPEQAGAPGQGTRYYDKILPAGQDPLLLRALRTAGAGAGAGADVHAGADADARAGPAAGLQPYETVYNGTPQNTTYNATFSVYAIPEGVCAGGCRHVCRYRDVADPETRAYLQKCVPPGVCDDARAGGEALSEGLSAAPAAPEAPGAPPQMSEMLQSNLKQLGLTMRQLCPVRMLPLSELAHFPTSEPGVGEFLAANVGAFVQEDAEIPFVNTGAFVESLRCLESSNFFLLEYLQSAETGREAGKARSLRAARAREAELGQLGTQFARLAHLAQNSTSDRVQSSAQHAEQALDRSNADLAALEDAIRRAYTGCMRTTGADAASLAPLTMLSRMEGRLERLALQVRGLPERYHVQYEKRREKARGKQRHLERQRAVAAAHDEKMRRAQARALEPIRRTDARRVMARSYPQGRRPLAGGAAGDGAGESEAGEAVEADFYE